MVALRGLLVDLAPVEQLVEANAAFSFVISAANAAGFGISAVTSDLRVLFSCSAGVTLVSTAATATLSEPLPVDAYSTVPVDSDGEEDGGVQETQKPHIAPFWSNLVAQVGHCLSRCTRVMRCGRFGTSRELCAWCG